MCIWRLATRVAAFGCALGFAFSGTDVRAAEAPAKSPGLLAKDVSALLQKHCVECHGGSATKNGFDVRSHESLKQGGEAGAPVVSGRAGESLLFQKINGSHKPAMPYRREKLPAAEIASVEAWINAGAPKFESLSAEADRRSEEWWSLQPLRKPELPQVKNKRWVRTPIDQFILAKLDEKGLKPSTPADKRTLLRRVYFDLIGLPPTPEDVKAFLKDTSADAFSKVVDRLLASPRYGERWARHWIDVVHFAETHGHDQDRIRTNAWPYRDYLIRSFNDDKPYARFVQEQIAGDALFPDDPQAVVALGFVAAGPWDESSLRDIREDTIDRQIGRYLDRDDMVMTTMSTFVSSTVHCARCHDHKFDPISQEEYYGLQAVFAGVDRAERPFDPDPQVHLRRTALKQKKAALERNDAAFISSLLTPEGSAKIAAWEKSLGEQTAVWTVLTPRTAESSHGSTLVVQHDGSVLSGGTRPEKDGYTITTHTDLNRVTALRLEVLTDDSLPHKGPGRQDNGNLHLSELRVEVASSIVSSAAPPVALRNPSADFNQDGWTIQHAIDGDLKTAWGIYPQVGKPHQAVFEFKEALTLASGAILRIVIEQQHGGGHLIGRVRLSVTTATPPVRIPAVPDAVAAVLAVAPDRRTIDQQRALAAHVAREEIERELGSLPKPQMVYAAANDFVPDGGHVPAKGPRPIHLLKRGDINRPGPPAAPGALECIPRLNARFDVAESDSESARRAALAGWITDSENTLAWRSIVNRVWQYHFGRGIVDTPNDFGRMGSTPTHPELIDWLSTWFIENGGSLKKLHRLILASAVYQQSSQHNPGFARIDADNRLLWRMNRTRLDAECVRDAMLQFSGKLDLTMGGPSVQHFALSPGIHVTPIVEYAKFDVDDPASRRRSIYRFLFRTLPDPFMDSMDCPDASLLAPTRSSSVTALQALSMLNNQFTVRYSEHFAERVSTLHKSLEGQVSGACELAWNRAPTASELRRLGEFASRHGLANTCRLLLNSNEFMFVN